MYLSKNNFNLINRAHEHTLSVVKSLKEVAHTKSGSPRTKEELIAYCQELSLRLETWVETPLSVALDNLEK